MTRPWASYCPAYLGAVGAPKSYRFGSDHSSQAIAYMCLPLKSSVSCFLIREQIHAHCMKFNNTEKSQAAGRNTRGLVAARSPGKQPIRLGPQCPLCPSSCAGLAHRRAGQICSRNMLPALTLQDAHSPKTHPLPGTLPMSLRHHCEPEGQLSVTWGDSPISSVKVKASLGCAGCWSGRTTQWSELGSGGQGAPCLSNSLPHVPSHPLP